MVRANCYFDESRRVLRAKTISNRRMKCVEGTPTQSTQRPIASVERKISSLRIPSSIKSIEALFLEYNLSLVMVSAHQNSELATSRPDSHFRNNR